MNILEIKQTMFNKGIPAEIMEQFVFPETEDETPEEKIAFAAQMDKLLTKDQILSVMEEQGCEKYAHEPAYSELMLKLNGKSVEERIGILNAMDINETAHYKINDDGTLSVFADHIRNGKYICCCPIIHKLSKPANVSVTYCGCCSGHLKYHSEQSLGVKLRLIEIVSSPISSSGERYCEHRFEII